MKLLPVFHIFFRTLLSMCIAYVRISSTKMHFLMSEILYQISPPTFKGQASSLSVLGSESAGHQPEEREHRERKDIQAWVGGVKCATKL